MNNPMLSVLTCHTSIKFGLDAFVMVGKQFGFWFKHAGSLVVTLESSL